MKYYKVCRVRCLLCGDILEHVNSSKTERSSLMLCSCRKVGLDPAAVMYRILGNEEDCEDLSEEWDDDAENLVQQVAGNMRLSGFELDEEDKIRIRRAFHHPEEIDSILAELIKEHTMDVKLYEEAMEEHRKNPVTYSHEEVERELGISVETHKSLEKRLTDYYGKPIDKIKRIKGNKE